MSIKPSPKKIYKIFPSYINYDGFVVHATDSAEEGTFDLEEARAKSTVILVNASEFQTITPTNPSPDISFIPSNDLTFDNTTTIHTVKKLKINSCTASEIEALKFVGKVATQKIVEARKDAKIESYAQLDRIAPLKSKKWEDIAVIDFELPDPTVGLVYDGLKTFGYTADATKPTPSA